MKMYDKMYSLQKIICILIILTNECYSTQDVHETHNNIQRHKHMPYIRTFTKYHHRRKMEFFTPKAYKENLPQSYERKLIKRSLNEKINYTNLAIDSSVEKIGNKRRIKIKAAIKSTEPPTTVGPKRYCLHKMKNVFISVTPTVKNQNNEQEVVEMETFDVLGPLHTIKSPTGDDVEVEECTDSRVSCYTLWQPDKLGNNKILGQGCWHKSMESDGCSHCTQVSQLPGALFSCCTGDYCNQNFGCSTVYDPKAVTTTAESKSNVETAKPNYTYMIVSILLALLAIIVLAVVIIKLYFKRNMDKDELSNGMDIEKGDMMGSGPDSLSTGLLCVDNLALIEHIGQGRFGSVWRGSLGSNPVAVKLYSNPIAWQRESIIYALPHLSHPNILHYYGSETRPTITEGGGREHLVVLELCSSTLRKRLETAPLSWQEFANLAHGLSSALAHLHSIGTNKPCIVHRDVNSNNVLVGPDGRARLADLGLAQIIHLHRSQQNQQRITEAGTLRYLAPEALEGALDLSGARAALCAVDVFALGLVLWEMVWRTTGAHSGPVPAYAQPYSHSGLTAQPTLAQLQSLVSRSKVRPPLPKGPVPEARVLKIAADTCDECWDHDAEARLTAVCVEERMADLKQMLHPHGPIIHDNNLNCRTQPEPTSLPETDKNSNCILQSCDATTPLLYPHPHIGRNACIERNTHTNTQSTVELIHKSLKDITVPDGPRLQNLDDNCLSVVRVSSRYQNMHDFENSNEIRSYQRPLDYVQNDVSSHESEPRGPKQTNLLHDVKIVKPWAIRGFFEKKLKWNHKLETEVKLVPESIPNGTKIKTAVVDKTVNKFTNKPPDLTINLDNDTIYTYEAPCTLSPPNRTLSQTENIFFKEIPNSKDEKTDSSKPAHIFAVIVPKIKTNVDIEMQSKLRENSETSLGAGNSISSDSMKKCNKITNQNNNFDVNSDCSSEDDLMLLSENGTKITMQSLPKTEQIYQSEVLKETSQKMGDIPFCHKYNSRYKHFDNEFSDPNDKENLVGYGDNPLYLAAINGEIETDLEPKSPKTPKPLKISIKRQRSLEQVSEIFSSSGDLNLQNPAGRVKTPGDLPIAIRKARRDKVLKQGRNANRLSLYDDRMMFGNSL